MNCKQCIHNVVCPHLKDEDAEKCKVFTEQINIEVIFDEVEKIILENTYPYFDKDGKACNIWKAKGGYDALEDLKKKYAGGRYGK